VIAQTQEKSTNRGVGGSSTRPLIGVTTYGEVADWANWPQPVVLAPQSYVESLVRAGASPVLLPSWTADAAEIQATLDRLDGLLLTGGDDVCGVSYGLSESPEEHEAGRHRPERDAFEIAAARHAWDADMPLLAICRGTQILNVALGGTLIPDLFSQGFAQDHRIERGVFNHHSVNFEPGTAIHSLYGATADVPSHHHQAIDGIGGGLVVTGRSDDGVIEAVQSIDRSFALGVQWHPEEGEDMVLFEALVRAAAARCSASFDAPAGTGPEMSRAR
jgi:putative glutamine amidotransferase